MLGIVFLFLTVVPLHAVLAIFGFRQLIPPLFLRWVGVCAGLRVRTIGRPHPGALFLANHVSWLDILALAGSARAIFVAHSGLAGHAGLRWLCRQNDTIFITRDRRGTVDAQVAQVQAALGDRPVTIFPEATTDDGRSLLPFRSSLLAAVEPLSATVPVQPVALEYADAAEIAWVGEEPGLANFRRVLSRPGRLLLTIHYLPPLESAELRDRKTMALAARNAIAAALHL